MRNLHALVLGTTFAIACGSETDSLNVEADDAMDAPTSDAVPAAADDSLGELTEASEGLQTSSATGGRKILFAFGKGNATDPALQQATMRAAVTSVVDSYQSIRGETFVVNQSTDAAVVNSAWVRRQLAAYKTLRSNDTFVFYGHTHGSNNGIMSGPNDAGIPWDELRDALLAIPAKNVIVAMMSCHSGRLVERFNVVAPRWNQRAGMGRNLLVLSAVNSLEVAGVSPEPGIGNPFTYAFAAAVRPRSGRTPANPFDGADGYNPSAASWDGNTRFSGKVSFGELGFYVRDITQWAADHAAYYAGSPVKHPLETGSYTAKNVFVLQGEATAGPGLASRTGKCPQATAGSSRVLVLRVTRTAAGVPLAPTCSIAQLRTATKSGSLSLASYFDIASNGAYRLDVSEPVDVRITQNDFECTDHAVQRRISDAADAAALAAGVNPADYSRVIYVVKRPAECGPSGATADKRILIWDGVEDRSGCDDAGLYAHEFGHTLGLDHPVDATDPSGERMDISCIMGNVPQHPLPNGPHLAALGWAPVMTNVRLGSDYELRPLEVGGSVLQLGKISISYRSTATPSEGLSAAFVTGASVHTREACQTTPTEALLLGTLGPSRPNIEVPVAEAGGSFYRITHRGLTSRGALVNVVYCHADGQCF